MALALPFPAELEQHKDGLSDSLALQHAADLFTLATGLTDTPTDLMEARLVKHALLDMAWYLQVQQDDREAEFSPFSSERIGSYSYSKMTQAVQSKGDTGVPGFDAAVSYFTSKNVEVWATSTEWVFTPHDTEDRAAKPHLPGTEGPHTVILPADAPDPENPIDGVLYLRLT